MLLSYDPDILSLFKTILNTIPTVNYNKIIINVNVLKNLMTRSCHFIKLMLKLSKYNVKISPDSSVGRAVD